MCGLHRRRLHGKEFKKMEIAFMGQKDEDHPESQRRWSSNARAATARMQTHNVPWAEASPVPCRMNGKLLDLHLHMRRDRHFLLRPRCRPGTLEPAGHFSPAGTSWSPVAGVGANTRCGRKTLRFLTERWASRAHLQDFKGTFSQ
jgi:hypothetical protein